MPTDEFSDPQLEVDCQMCADSGLMSVMGPGTPPKMEVYPCLCARGIERSERETKAKPNDR